MPDRSYIDAQAGDTSAVNLRYAVQVYTAPSGLRLLDTFGTLSLTSAVNLHKQVILVYCSVVKFDRCLRLVGEK